MIVDWSERWSQRLRLSLSATQCLLAMKFLIKNFKAKGKVPLKRDSRFYHSNLSCTTSATKKCHLGASYLIWHFYNLQLIKLTFKITGLPLINISIFYTFSFQYTYKNLGPLLNFWSLLLAPKLFNGKHFETYFLGIKKPRFKLKKCDLNNTQLNYCPNRYTCLTLKSVNRVRLLTHRSFSFKQFNYNLASSVRYIISCNFTSLNCEPQKY